MNIRHSWNFRQKLAKITEYWAKISALGAFSPSKHGKGNNT
jgi:hypothetical protein